MNKFSKFVLILTVCAGMTACSGGMVVEDNYNVIPQPKEIIPIEGMPFLLTSSVKIFYPAGNKQMKQNAEFLSSYIDELTGYTLALAEGSEENGIQLKLDGNISNPEGYRLQIDSKGIEIAGATEAGVFYGIQTLRKSISADISRGSRIELPAVSINDYPRFSYRGMMLDVGRHFFSVDSIKIYLDMLALHNINRFHWHLSDDQGWRIEIKKYPKLTEIGSQRTETVIGHNSGEYDGQPYSGYYTQEEIRDVIVYAAERHITIVPEIDLPGHQQAALASYPELGCTGGPYEVWRQWGISDDVICAGNDNAMQFLEDVLAEVIDLFPSEYIHVGGDECPKVRWKECPKCQARIKAEGIKGDKKHTAEEYLQSYVIKRMAKFVESKGRKIIGWNEILEGGLPENATVMSWLGTEGGIEAARQQHDVIMTPNTYVYFDYYQSTDTEHEPIAIGGYIPLEKVYSFEPTDGIPEEGHKYVIGAQANLWTEYIPNFKQVQYMVLPRMDALSEVQWCNSSQKDYQSFLFRLTRMTKLYDKLGYNYGKHIYDPNVSLEPKEEVEDMLTAAGADADLLRFSANLNTQVYTGDNKYGRMLNGANNVIFDEYDQLDIRVGSNVFNLLRAIYQVQDWSETGLSYSINDRGEYVIPITGQQRNLLPKLLSALHSAYKQTPGSIGTYFERKFSYWDDDASASGYSIDGIKNGKKVKNAGVLDRRRSVSNSLELTLGDMRSIYEEGIEKAQRVQGKEKGCLKVTITKLGDGEIYYTTDGSEPTAASHKYTSPIEIKENADIKVLIIRPDGSKSRTFTETVSFNKATMKPITLKQEPSRGYVFNGASVLADGLKGNSNYKTGRWLGFQGKDIDAIIDLKKPIEFSRVSFNTNVVKGDWIMGATGIIIKVSDDGKAFHEVANKPIAELTAGDKDGIYPQEVSFDPQTARYVEVIIKGGKLPAWHGGAGNPAYIFVDEISIE